MEFVDQSNDIMELAKALVNVQKEMSPATKDGKNPFTKSSYATLNSVMESCRTALLNNNIWLCQYPVPVEYPDSIGLMTKLTHTESGQWQRALCVVPLPKSDPQGMGSAITYARRYAITALLGMVTEDDDGESAKITTASKNNRVTQPKPGNQKSVKPVESIPEEYPDRLDECPVLDGVTYALEEDQSGNEYIIAYGNTHSKRSILAEAGFRWNPNRKVWWKHAA